MTNKELQEKLKDLPPEAEVRMWIAGNWSTIKDVEYQADNFTKYIDLIDSLS
jgi:hypothetical protein